MKRRHTIHEETLVLLFLLISGIFFFIKAFEYQEFKLFPLITSSIVILFSIICLPESIRKGKIQNQKIEEDEHYHAEISFERLQTPMVGYGAMVFYAILIPLLGFFTSTAIFLIGLMFYLGYRNWMVMVGVTAGIEIAIYLLFVVKLMVRIPHGIFY